MRRQQPIDFLALQQLSQEIKEFTESPRWEKQDAALPLIIFKKRR